MTDLDILRRLVAFDSTSHLSNRPIADFLCDLLDRPGIRITRQPAPEGDKLNLIVEIGPPTDPASRAGLVLSGHMDVVPALEPEWQSDPFELVERDDKLFGRGACDMKGFVALAVGVALRAAESGLAVPLVLILTYDEEVGTLGAGHFARTWDHAGRPLPRRAVIGEPTSLAVVRLHKGHAKSRLIVRGTPAHSGYPHLGHNAIEPLGRAIVALAALRRELETERPSNSEFFPEVPFVALNQARIKGGSAINIVPERAELELGFRVLPGMDSTSISARVEQRLAGALAGEDWSLEPINESPPMALPDSDDLYQTLCAHVGQENTVSASYATDAGWLERAGFSCLLYGPGDIATAHKPNEWLPIAEFERAARDLEFLIERFCGAK